MGRFDSDSTVLSIKNRIKGLGINLDQYLGEILNKWNSTPMGFEFTCKSPATYSDLMKAVTLNPNCSAVRRRVDRPDLEPIATVMTH